MKRIYRITRIKLLGKWRLCQRIHKRRCFDFIKSMRYLEPRPIYRDFLGLGLFSDQE